MSPPGTRLSSVHLLAHAVRSVRNGLGTADSPVHLVNEDPQERVAKLVSSVRIKEPCEDVGQLPLVTAIAHHVEYVELLLRLLGQYRKKPRHQLLTHSTILRLSRTVQQVGRRHQR